MLKSKKSDMFIVSLAKVSRNPTKASIELAKRLNNMLASCKNRDKKYKKETYITIDMLRELVITAIGTKCKYCNEVITHKNISMDHIKPLSLDGQSTIDNIQFICKTCNRRKDKMSDNEFIELNKFLDTLSEPSRKMILQKLSMGGFNASYKKK